MELGLNLKERYLGLGYSIASVDYLGRSAMLRALGHDWNSG
jgi:hypothetical protein